ncbi:MAG: hypothetical protein ACOYB4_06355 [Methyloceanibacter sp.]
MEFSIRSALSFGWETFKKRPWFFIGATLLVIFIYIVAGVVTGLFEFMLTGDPENPSGAGSIIDWLISTLINMGVVAFYLHAHDDVDKVTLGALWHPHPYWKYFATVLLVGLAVGLGMLLLIVPGVIFLLMFMFAAFIVIDRELGPIDAMKESRRITRGARWQLLGFVLVAVLINLLGAIALGVGLLVTIPVTTLAFVQAYRVLSAKAGAEPVAADASLTHTT